MVLFQGGQAKAKQSAPTPTLIKGSKYWTRDFLIQESEEALSAGENLFFLSFH